MLDIIISFLTFVTLLVSLFLVLVILMQRANSNAGMGSAFGGGVTESAFGAETTNVLVRATKWAAFAFFILSLVLFLLYMSKKAESGPAEADLPDIPVVQQEAPAMDPAVQATATETTAEGEDIVQQVKEEVDKAVDAMAEEVGNTEPPATP
jgi:preprotein translocase subunit SecG